MFTHCCFNLTTYATWAQATASIHAYWTSLHFQPFLVSAALASGFLLWHARRARISLRNEVLIVLDTRLQELRNICLQLRDDVDQCGVALDALRAARQSSDDSIASLAHVTGWQLHAHHAQLDRLERYIIADFHESAPFRLSLSPPR